MSDDLSTSPAAAPLAPEHAEALGRLRDEAGRIAGELQRLRSENAALKARIEELEAHPGLAHDGALLAFEAPPDVLRKHITQFIDAIDRHLARHPSSK